MTDIPKDLINQLRAALTTIGDLPHQISDTIRSEHGDEIAMALDDLLATSYQIVIAGGKAVQFPPKHR